jgi:hypothetical protein
VSLRWHMKQNPISWIIVREGGGNVLRYTAIQLVELRRLLRNDQCVFGHIQILTFEIRS